MPNELDDLFFKYHADKTPRIKHHYSDVYYELFKDRQETVKKVLEIGTAEGASLYAWRDFFPNAMIYGAEIDPLRVDLMKLEKRIQVYRCDQSRVSDTDRLLGNTGFDLDIIIDDGSHNPDHQINTCLDLMPMLPIGVTYIIEDVDDKSVGFIISKLGRYSVEERHVGSRHDDRLLIVRHK